jgi:tetratricopeptide (TPR) repeat protein
MKSRARLILVLGFMLFGFVLVPFNVNAQAPAVKRDTGKSKKAYTDGAKLYNQKNYRDAVAKFEESIRYDATNELAHFFKGYSHYYLKEYDQALAELNTAEQLKYKPAVEVSKARAFVQYQRKDYDAAMADIRQVLAAEPKNLDYLKLSGEISLGMKNYDEALATYQKVSDASPGNGNLVYAMAQIYAAKGDLDGQAAAAEKAIQMGTQFFAEAQLLLADAYVKLGRSQQAEAALLKVTQVKPDVSKDIYRTLSDMYRSQSRFTEAIDITRKAIKLFPNDGDLYTDASWYYSLAGRHEEAVQAAQAGIRFKPTESMAYTNLCRAYNDLQKPELAISSCNSALKIKPDDGETFFYLGRAYDVLNKPAEATQYYKKAVVGLEASTSQNPTYSDGFYLLGNAYFADGQLDKAIAAYSKCLEMNPRFARARFNIGMVQLQKNNKNGATEQYNILMSLDKTLATKLKTEIDKVPNRP